MEQFELREAQLLRLLSDTFGADQVIAKASVSMVCSGQIPKLSEQDYPGFEMWSKKFKCLFTIINNQDEPCLVVEFFGGFAGDIDPFEAEREVFLPTVLKSKNIFYFRVTEEDFRTLIDPDMPVSLLDLLSDKYDSDITNGEYS